MNNDGTGTFLPGSELEFSSVPGIPISELSSEAFLRIILRMS